MENKEFQCPAFVAPNQQCIRSENHEGNHAAASNDLYLAILPLIHVSNNQALGFGLTEETLTLFPDRNFATEFFADEVDGYIVTFKNRTKYLIGGHVKGWDIHKEPTEDGRVIVRVVQYVTQ
jgi:hypothetical protein